MNFSWIWMISQICLQPFPPPSPPSPSLPLPVCSNRRRLLSRYPKRRGKKKPHNKNAPNLTALRNSRAERSNWMPSKREGSAVCCISIAVPFQNEQLGLSPPLRRRGATKREQTNQCVGFFLFPKKSMANILTVPDEGMCTGYYYGMRFLLVSFMA